MSAETSALKGEELKSRVKAHWEAESCGARYGEGQAERRDFFAQIEQERYRQDYMIPGFADFSSAKGKKVLEVGLGTGTDFMQWCRAGAQVTGRDLTDAAVGYVKERLQLEGLQADVSRGDAEALDLPSETFDIYYSWGVLHHTPDPEKAFAEACRVLKPGGTLKIMVYHYHSIATLLVWLANGPLRFNFQGPRACFFDHVESPGTKVYTRREIFASMAKLFPAENIKLQTYLAAGDLLNHKLSKRYSSPVWKILIALYPTWFVKAFVGHRLGSVLTVTATKKGRS
jgi:ubiquinone/menaquinone biosynthesis C-methylase UbiE